jgi:hypothetical protein
MNFILDIVLILMVLLNIILHSVGIYLLSCLHNRDVHELYLINLSASEILVNVCELLARRIPRLITFTGAALHFVKDIQEFASIVNGTLISITYYLSMVYITIDKLLDIFLNIKYAVYWNTIRAKYLIQFTWVFSVSVCLCTSLAYYFQGFEYKNTIRKFFMTPFDVFFIVLTIITYIFIFMKFRQTRGIPQSNDNLRSNVIGRRTCWYIFRHSRFFVSVWMILTFVLFMVVPDFIHLFYGMIHNNDSSALRDITMIVYQVAYLSDVLIYIFMHHPVRLLLWKKMRIRRIRSNIRSSINKARKKRVFQITKNQENTCDVKTVETVNL